MAKDKSKSKPAAKPKPVAPTAPAAEVPSGFVEGDGALPEWDCSCGNFPGHRVSARDAGEAKKRYGEVLGVWSFPSEPTVLPAPVTAPKAPDAETETETSVPSDGAAAGDEGEKEPAGG